MGNLGFTAVLNNVASNYLSGITDFEIFNQNGRLVLYSASVSGNGLSAFEINEGFSASFIEETGLPERSTLAPLDLAVISLQSGNALWVEPWLQSGLRSYSLGSLGQIGPVSQFSGAPLLNAGVTHATAQDDGGGGTWVYGGFWNSSGIVRLSLDGTGNLVSADEMNVAASEDVAALSHVELGVGSFLFSARTTNAAVTSWAIGATGDLVEKDNIGYGDGLGLSIPTALETVEMAGQNYLILASAGSSSLMVIKVLADGSLELRDHVIDTLNTRFLGVDALELVNHHGRIFVVAGGSDDGISLFQLLPGGQLLHLESLADTNETTLDNVSAIEVISVGDEIQVMVASENERGITQFTFTPDVSGQILVDVKSGKKGSDNADVLKAGRGDVRVNGHGGNDIIIDGSGSDRLSGGEGEDIFVFGGDNSKNYILDFNPSEDKIDVSAFSFLRNLNQLEITSTAKGAKITYENETIVITSHDKQPLAVLDVSNSILLETQHSLPLDGWLGRMNFTGDNLANVFDGGTGEDRLLGKSGDDVLSGKAENDVIKGGSGKDTLNGGSGNDLLEGGSGDDELTGGSGVDRLYGGGNDDTLKGGTDNDVLKGGRGDDLLVGDKGDDLLFGGAGRDELQGGWGRDELKGDAGKDHLFGGKGNDKLNGGTGADILEGGLGQDQLIGGAGADVFVFTSGRDRIKDFNIAEDRLHLDADLWVGTLTDQDVITQFATSNGRNTTLEFIDGTWLRLEGIVTPDDLLGVMDFI